VAVAEPDSEEAIVNVTTYLNKHLKTCLAIAVAASVGTLAAPASAKSWRHHYHYGYRHHYYGYPHYHGNYFPYAYGSYGPYTPNLPSPPHGISPDFQSGGYR
jgi:hypothetical protein